MCMVSPEFTTAGPLAAAPPTLAATERSQILAALEQTGWRIRGPAGAAALLGLKPTTLESPLKKLGLERPRSAGPPPLRPIGAVPRSRAVPPGASPEVIGQHRPQLRDSRRRRPRRAAR